MGQPIAVRTDFNGPERDRGRGPLTTSARNRPTCSVPYARSSEPAPLWCCPSATARPCSFISTRSPARSALALTPSSSSIEPAGTEKELKVPHNISLMPLPPRSPELNSQENIWQFMRQNWLSNRVFKSYDNIVDHCCYAWNTLIDQPWKIMSIALRDWAYIGRSI